MQVDSEEILNSENNRLVLNTFPNILNTKFEQICLDEAVALHNAGPIHQSIATQISDKKYSILRMTRTTFLTLQIPVIGMIVGRWVWDSDMVRAHVADEIALRVTTSLVTTAMRCIFLTGKIVVWLLLLIIWGNTVEDWVNMAQNDCLWLIGREQEWCLL